MSLYMHLILRMADIMENIPYVRRGQYFSRIYGVTCMEKVCVKTIMADLKHLSISRLWHPEALRNLLNIILKIMMCPDNTQTLSSIMKIRAVLNSTRWPFLILTPACLFLGWSIVIASQARIEMDLLVLSFLGAVFAHISVNTLNEYLDFRSGLDLMTKKTGFSGGSGALPENPEMAKAVLATGVISLIATLVIGLFFFWKYGWGVVPLGVAGVLLIVAYTGWINRYPLICLVAPGFGFGFLMVAGANFALTGGYSESLLVICFVPFFLVNNLLLLNQYPDIDADRAVGRNHLPIAYGIKTSNAVYGLFATTVIAVVAGSVVAGILPVVSLVALLPMPLAFYSLRGAIKYGSTLGKYPQYLGANVMVTILSTALLGVSIITG